MSLQGQMLQHNNTRRMQSKILRMEKLLISAHSKLEDRELKAFIQWEIQERKRRVSHAR
jgi:hypothetical protein